MADRLSRLYVQALVAVALGCVGFAALGAAIGRGIAAVGDPTAATAVPVIVCSAVGFAIGGAFGSNIVLQRTNRGRTGLASSVVLVALLLTLVAAAALSATTGLTMVVFLPVGPPLAALLAVQVSAVGGSGGPSAGTRDAGL